MIRSLYPSDWNEIALAVKEAAATRRRKVRDKGQLSLIGE